jgi:hypothetical protein
VLAAVGRPVATPGGDTATGPTPVAWALLVGMIYCQPGDLLEWVEQDEVAVSPS